ncbi:Palmitoyltransferase [Kalmusia sp. IMI 367209]|nr:Palmitoyltransferase [Kalmusia sp. IMI 367209]
MELNQIAVPGVYLLIFFLGYPSQILFYYLDPAPLTKSELYVSNLVLILIFITYTKSVFVDPGTIPKTYGKGDEKENGNGVGRKGEGLKRTKWCRKCDAAKPPRAHHCKECKRCIPKMDHHCPWTANCVSHTTFPHFLRFLMYTTSGLSWLEYLLWIRISYLWENRNMPAYLGPNPFLVAHLFAATVINSITVFAIGVLLVRNIWCLAVNTTTIEGWEIERHKTLLRRARHFGGMLQTPDGTAVPIKRQEFPYDIGIWSNITQGMGTANVRHPPSLSLSPLLQNTNKPSSLPAPIMAQPLAATPPMQTGLAFPTNGFEDPALSWPPPDPDRSYRRPQPTSDPSKPFTFTDSTLSPQESSPPSASAKSPTHWRGRQPERGGELAQPEGERLKDFGVDEEVEFYDEQEEEDDDVPLGAVGAQARRRAAGGGDARNAMNV